MQEDLRRKIWLLVLAALVFFISFPVVLMIYLDNRRYYSYLTEDLWETQMKIDFMEIMGYGNIWMVVITFVGATLCGIFAYSYLYKKKKVDFYHSIPVRREKLFFASYLNGVLIYVIPYLITILVSMVIAGNYFTLDRVVWSVVWREFGVQVLYYLLLYHTAILASVLAGNMFGCIFLNGIAQLYVIFVYGIFVGYCDYFDTYTAYSANFSESIAMFSPIVVFFHAISRLLGNDVIYMLRLRDGEASIKLYLMQSFLVAVLLLGIALYFYKIRSSEMAGRAIAFPKMQSVLRILLVIPSAMMGGLIFGIITTNKIGWMLFGMAFAAILAHGVVEVLYQADIRGILSHKIQLVGTIVVAVVLGMVFRYDLLGYDTYVPKLERIESAAISVNGLADGESYRIENISGGYNWLSSQQYELEKMKLSGELIPAVWQLMSLGAEANKDYQQVEDSIGFYLKVRLKGGREELRYYTVELDKAYPFLYEIFQSQEYKEKTYAYFFENYSNTEVKVEVKGLVDWRELSKENGIAFLEIYRKEFLELTLDEVRDNPVIGKVTYYIPNEKGVGRRFEMLLYPVMTESLHYLEQIGILEQDIFWVQPKVEDIVALQIAGYYTERDIEGEGAEDTERYYRVEITEEEQIQRLCQNLYFNISQDNWMFWWRNGCEIEVKLKPELSEKYFNESETQLEVVFRSSKEEDIAFFEQVIQEGKVVD